MYTAHLKRLFRCFAMISFSISLFSVSVHAQCFGHEKPAGSTETENQKAHYNPPCLESVVDAALIARLELLAVCAGATLIPMTACALAIAGLAACTNTPINFERLFR